MIKHADRLIARHILSALALVWLLLTGIDALFALLKQLDQIGEGSTTLGTVVVYIAWTLPRRVYEMFGVAAVLGAVLGMGALAPTSELTALRAAGFSKARLAGSALALILIITLPVMWIGETLGPEGERRAQGIAVAAKSMNMIASSSSGLWARDRDELVNARHGRVLPGTIELIDVRIYRFDSVGRLLAITKADLADFHQTRWRLQKVTTYRFSEDAVLTDSSDGQDWPTAIDPRLMSLTIVQPRYQSARDLNRHIEYLRRNALADSAFVNAFWTRMLFPLNVIAPLLLALPLVFGSLRSGGFGKRLLFGLVVTVGYYIVVQPTAVDLAAVVGLPIMLAHLLPALVLIGAGGLWLRRA